VFWEWWRMRWMATWTRLANVAVRLAMVFTGRWQRAVDPKVYRQPRSPELYGGPAFEYVKRGHLWMLFALWEKWRETKAGTVPNTFSTSVTVDEDAANQLETEIEAILSEFQLINVAGTTALTEAQVEGLETMVLASWPFGMAFCPLETTTGLPAVNPSPYSLRSTAKVTYNRETTTISDYMLLILYERGSLAGWHGLISHLEAHGEEYWACGVTAVSRSALSRLRICAVVRTPGL